MKRKSTEIGSGIATREELEAEMDRYAAARIAEAAEKAAMEEDVRLAREKHEESLAARKAEAEASFRVLERWARANPGAFAEKKSLELVHGRIGFRTGMPRLSVPRGADEAALCEALLASGLAEAVRTERRLDASRIIALAAAAQGTAAAETYARLRAAFGVHVTQAERFFAEERGEKGAE